MQSVIQNELRILLDRIIIHFTRPVHNISISVKHKCYVIFEYQKEKTII